MTRMTDTQKGAISEHVVAASLMLASDGRLSPYLPIADDDGIDLLVYDKLSKTSFPVQVKSRSKPDKAARGTVQFDVRRATFSEDGYLLALLFGDGASVARSWLVPMHELPSVAGVRKDKFVLTPSPKETSNDRYSPYRCADLEEATQRLLEALA
ncbi:MAG: hypothetical protein AAF607_16325 [Pseudomonadota bacterium]